MSTQSIPVENMPSGLSLTPRSSRSSHSPSRISSDTPVTPIKILLAESSKPTLHLQLYVPIVFIQSASAWHSRGLVLIVLSSILGVVEDPTRHSSMSLQSRIA